MIGKTIRPASLFAFAFFKEAEALLARDFGYVAPEREHGRAA